MIIDISGTELTPWDYENCKGKTECCDECDYFLCCMSDDKACKACDDPYCTHACKTPQMDFNDLDIQYIREELK